MITDEDLIRRRRNNELATESFLRRAAQVEAPFMLKGSHVTRQYFTDPQLRYAGDLDWVYLLPLEGVDMVKTTFQNWMLEVCRQPANDGIYLSCGWEGLPWRELDYAMADDFPTISSLVEFEVNGVDEGAFVSIDFSFNLPVEVPPVPLRFRPHQGVPYELPLTAPLALQVSWKLHQSLVRLRLKDIFDLMHLLQHPQFTPEVAAQSWQALVNECDKDKVDIMRLRYVLEGRLEKLVNREEGFPYLWKRWRNGYEFDIPQEYNMHLNEAPAFIITNTFLLPESAEAFQQQLRHVVQKSGIAEWLKQ